MTEAHSETICDLKTFSIHTTNHRPRFIPIRLARRRGYSDTVDAGERSRLHGRVIIINLHEQLFHFKTWLNLCLLFLISPLTSITFHNLSEEGSGSECKQYREEFLCPN